MKNLLNHFHISFIITFLAVAALTVSCNEKKNDPVPDNTPGTLTLALNHKVGDQPLNFDTEYTNAVGEKFQLTLFDYFISNIKLVKEDGSVFAFNQDSSYFLIRHVNGKNVYEAKLNQLPVGKYTHIEFMIGVDSLRSVSDISKRQGILDPATGAQGMYWTWNSGYIFVKCEGTSPQAPEDANGNRRFRYHIGGFGGYSSPMFNNIKVIRLPLNQVVQVMGRQNLVINLDVDALRLFNGPTNISIASNPTVMVHPFSVQIANNYMHMFKLSNTQVK